ncbi:MAG: porin family protein [Bacteroidaceae bacterium]|nr:porin family protein [Bacteroidaceae bacterium]
MKKIKVLFAVCLMLMTSTVFAQSEDAWKGVRVAYNNFDTDTDGADAVMALSAGYVHSFAVSQNIPLFLEVGGNILWVNGDVMKIDGVDIKLKMFAVELPVNFGYKWNINDDWSIFPYVGATFRGYISGKLGDQKVFDDAEGFEKWKRFTAGAHVGVTANYKNYNLGVKYGMDLNEITDNSKVKTWTISLGYNF